MSEPYWVPLSSAPQPLNYAGAYSGAASYRPGDVVLYNGVYYMAAAVSTGQTPPAGGPAAAVQTGLTLPASPYDGQEYLLVDSLTVPTYAWRFRYSAAITDAYKWVFVGGSPARQEITTDQTFTTINVAQDVATPGPLIVLPRAGNYRALGGSQFWSSIANETFTLVMWNGTLATYGPGGAMFLAASGVNIDIVTAATATGLAAGTDLRLRYVHNTAGTCHVLARWIEVQPVRVA